MTQKVIAGIMRDFFHETDSLFGCEITSEFAEAERCRCGTMTSIALFRKMKPETLHANALFRLM